MKKLLLFLMSFFTFFAFGQLSEGFEGATFPPTGWVVEDNGIGTSQSWGITTATGFGWVYQGARSAMVNRDNGATSTGLAQDWLITPQVTIPTNGQVRFYARSGIAPHLYPRWTRIAPLGVISVETCCFTFCRCILYCIFVQPTRRYTCQI